MNDTVGDQFFSETAQTLFAGKIFNFQGRFDFIKCLAAQVGVEKICDMIELVLRDPTGIPLRKYSSPKRRKMFCDRSSIFRIYTKYELNPIEL